MRVSTILVLNANEKFEIYATEFIGTLCEPRKQLLRIDCIYIKTCYRCSSLGAHYMYLEQAVRY